MSVIRILIADDETLMRRLLAQMLALESDFEVIGEAANGKQAVELAFKLRPDLIIMDLNMPAMNRAEATERIVARHPHIKVIILTSLEELAPVGKMAGAFECIDKSVTPAELVAAIRRARAARGPLPGPSAFSEHKAVVERLAMRVGLTAREQSVVEKVVATELTLQQVALALSWESNEKITESAVKHGLDRAMIKLRLEPRTRTALIKHVLEFEQGK